MANKSKTLYWDVETSYILARLWRSGKQDYVGPEQILEGHYNQIICIGYRWAHESKAKVITWNNKTHNGKAMLKKFSKIIESANVAIAHNGDKFDVKILNSDLLMHGLPPISYPNTEDTLKLAKQKLSLPSYRLDYLAKVLLGEGKSPMGLQDWEDVIEGSSQKIRDAALEKMSKYCIRDVELLKRVHEAIIERVDPKVNRSLLVNGNRKGCPSCGYIGFTSSGYHDTKAGRYQRRRCKSCKHPYKHWQMEKQKRC